MPGYSSRILLVAVVAIIAASSLVGVTIYSQDAGTQEQSGPISTWPASWSNFCNIPGDNSGNDTTNNSLANNYTPGLGNITFDQLYLKIINSQSFQNVTNGKGWVTTYWGTQEESGPGYSDSYVVTQFILISAGKPNGYLTTHYDVATENVTANYQQSGGGSCPAIDVIGPSETSTSNSGTTNSTSNVYQGTAVTISPVEFTSVFWSEVNVEQAIYNIGQPVEILTALTNEGSQVVDIETNSCSLSYKILNLTDNLVYNSAAHTSCGSYEDNPAAPRGGLGSIVYWNQTSDSGRKVGAGVYQVVETFQLVSGGQEMNQTARSVFQIGATSPSSGSSPDQITIQSSSVSPAGLVSANLVTTSNLDSIHMYANGVSLGTKNYTGLCCSITYELTINLQLNQTVPVDSHRPYVIVLIGTFEDGSTSVTWASPIPSN